MDTSNDYLYALQLQNIIDLTENGNSFNNTPNYTDETGSVKYVSASSSFDAVVDLTGEVSVSDNKHKLTAVGDSSQPVKKPSHKRVKVLESVVDHSWETLDPNPDIHGLFLAFNRQYFWNYLSVVTVKWSNRMTVCAGLCRYEGGFCSISLSEPLLKLRPRKDLVETLLHEMIHAYLFLTNNREHRDRDGHGPEFCKHMFRINKIAGTKISIYHSFHDEVRLYRQHWWKCNGPCQNNKPFYGYVKRSINRAPGPYDKWWANHQALCSGTFIKVKEPEGYGLKKKPVVSSVPKKSVQPANKITNFIKILDSPIKILDSPIKNYPVGVKINSTSIESGGLETVPTNINLESSEEMTMCPVCNESVFTEWLNEHLQNCSHLIEMFGDKINDKCECPACNVMVDRSLMNEHLDNCKMLSNVFENDDIVDITEDGNYVNCPSCNKMVKDNNMNEHLDICLLGTTEGETLLTHQDVQEQNSVKNPVVCPCCKMIFENIIELDDHVDKCLLY